MPRSKKPSSKVSMALAQLEKADSEAFQASVAPSCGRAIHAAVLAAEWYGRSKEGFSQIKNYTPALAAAVAKTGKMLSKGMDNAIKKCGAKSVID